MIQTVYIIININNIYIGTSGVQSLYFGIGISDYQNTIQRVNADSNCHYS